MSIIAITPSSSSKSSSVTFDTTNGNIWGGAEATDYGRYTVNGTSTYNAIIKKFKFNLIPEGAIITRATLRIKACGDNMNTSSSTYQPYFAKSSTRQANTSIRISAALGSPEIYSYDIPLVDFKKYIGYGDDFNLYIPMKRSSSSRGITLDLYGIDILVEYTLPSISVKENGTWVKYSKLYKKENGTWVEKNTTSITDEMNKYDRLVLKPISELS